jgi:hypothetical protein
MEQFGSTQASPALVGETARLFWLGVKSDFLAVSAGNIHIRCTVSKMMNSEHPSENDRSEPSKGTKIANWQRERANQFTAEKRQELLEKGLARIYGGSKRKKAATHCS